MTNLENKINTIIIIPPDAVQVRVEVKSLFSNIKHNDGLLLLGENSYKIIAENPLTEIITILLRDRLVIYCSFCLDVAQGCMNGAPNKNQTHS